MSMTSVFERIRNLPVFPRRQTLWAFVVIVGISLWVLNANPFAGQTVAPFDLLLAQPGWITVPWDNKVLNNEASDILDGQLPTWITLKEQIRAGKGALWYPLAAGGKALDTEPFNPAFLLFLVIKDNVLAYYMVGLFKLVIAGFGGYLLLKTFLKWVPSMWGGIVFMLCGFNVAWFFYDQVTTAMWIPWLLAATVMYLRTDDLRWLPAITIVAFLLILGGFFSVAAFGLYAFGLLVLTWNAYDFAVHVRASGKDGRKLKPYLIKFALPMFAVGIAFLLSAITLIPFIDGLKGVDLSYRAGTTYGTGTIFGAGTNFKNGVKDLLLLIFYEYPLHIERTAFIGLPAVILAFVSIFQFFRSKDEGCRKFIFFHVLLVIITTLITFGLLPHEFIGSLPIFSNNSWGRLVVVLLLGLSALSSVGMDYIITESPAFLARHVKLAPVIARRTMMVVVIAVIAIQFGSQKIFFNDCIAVVPSTWFYPLTPSIQYVKERLKPLQSVIADNSYSISGTLGAYGIAEWYGHSLFTDKEKEVLGRLVIFPFGSPTSAFIDPSNIVFNSPLMDKLMIKYVLIDRNRALHKTLHSLQNSSDQAPPLPANSWRQRISLGKDMTIDSLAFKFATYGEANAPANVHLKLYNENEPQFPVESELDRNAVADNAWALFEFPGPVTLKKGVYYLELSLPGYAGPKSVTAWAARNKDRHAADYLEINGAKTDLSLEWGIAYYDRVDSNVFGDKWNLVDQENTIAILENKHVSNSAYFVKDLDASNDHLDFSGLDVNRPASDEIDITYSKQESGWIVLPMRLNPGWRAYIDNRQTRYDTYLDILPAIPVSGPSHIVFSYQPGSFWKGLAVSLAGFCILLVFSAACLKKKQPVKVIN